MNWTREFIQGTTVFMIRPRAEEFQETAELVAQLMPTLFPGEEIRIQVKRKPVGQPDEERSIDLPWGQ
jgi:hypothetical protein